MALPAHRETEIGFFLEHSEAVGYAIAPTYRNFDYARMAISLKEQQPSLKFVLTSDDSDESAVDSPGFLSIRKLIESPNIARPQFRGDPFDVALFLVSGGTTGLPKLIPRTHADYLYNARVMNEVCELDSSTVFLVAIPVSHNFGLAAPGLMGTLLANGTRCCWTPPRPTTSLRRSSASASLVYLVFRRFTSLSSNASGLRRATCPR